ncbi:MAG: hypothetical protein AMXMBFR13_35430 [Phycisphaerae bacterium]
MCVPWRSIAARTLRELCRFRSRNWSSAYQNSDESFDGVVANLVFCTISDPVAALREVCRVLRKGGLLYAYEHVISRNRAYGVFQNFTAPLVAWFCEGCHWNWDFTKYLQGLTFRIERHENLKLRVGLLPPLPIVRRPAIRE